MKPPGSAVIPFFGSMPRLMPRMPSSTGRRSTATGIGFLYVMFWHDAQVRGYAAPAAKATPQCEQWRSFSIARAYPIYTRAFMILEDGREIRAGARIEIWDA